MNQRKNLSVLFPILVSFLTFFLYSCSDDNAVDPVETDPDYFPTSGKIVWTYHTNAILDTADFIFQMKVDSADFEKGRFLALVVSIDGIEWFPMVGLKDSANVVYSLGDHPAETAYPLFKHKYGESECVKEKITIQNKQYDAVKVAITTNEGTIYLWFADGIGLIKEYSTKGMSLFSDNNWGKNKEIITELVSYQN